MSSVLVCTDVAAMGLDVDDLNLTVNIGNSLFSNSFKNSSLSLDKVFYQIFWMRDNTTFSI